MRFINHNTVLIEGDIYTNMIMNADLLTDGGISLHAKGDVFFGVMEPPNNLRRGDFYLDYIEFAKTYGPIHDLIACTNIAGW